MTTGIPHYLLSGLVGGIQVTMLLINLMVLYFFIRGNLHRSAKSPLYVILFYNICCGTIQNLTHIIFQLPMIITKEPLIPRDSPLMAVLAVWFLHLWYNATYVHIIMAINRVSALCWPRISEFFTVKNIIKMLILASIGGMCTSMYTQHYSSCCRIYFEPITYGYNYMPNYGPNMTFNVSQLLVDLPLESAVSLICVASYFWVFTYIYRMQKRAGLKGRGHRREIMCCVQCCLVFSFYSFTWASFHVFPRLGFTSMEPYAFTTIVYNIDCGINSIVLIINNEEVRRQMKNAIGSRPEFSASHPEAASKYTPEKPSPTSA